MTASSFPQLVSLILKCMLGLIFLFLSVWGFCYDFWIVYVWLLMLAGAYLFGRAKIFRFRTYMIFFLTYILFLPLTLKQYQIRSDAMFRQIQAGEDLSTKEKFSIYGLNIVIACLAYPIYPEISTETLIMMVPAKKDVREFEDDFFLESSKIKEAIRTGKKNVSWKTAEYALGGKESRYALALNPCQLKTEREGNITHYRVEVMIEYPKNLEVMLVRFPFEVSLQEGLFGYLQREGWLFPYLAIWHCTLKDINQQRK